jgi:hypothetical protein
MGDRQYGCARMTRVPANATSMVAIFDDLKKWRARHNDSDLQKELQRRAEEARKKLEADRKNPN